ncbi:DUF58 domain-containing protein [Niabella terrae]
MKSIFFHKTVYYTGGVCAALFMAGYFVPVLFQLAQIGLFLLLLSTGIDLLLLYRIRQGIVASRQLPDKLSIGDENTIRLFISNRYPYALSVQVIDELPIILQVRDWQRRLRLPAKASDTIIYQIRPLSRGLYFFDQINVIVDGPLHLVKRRYIIKARQEIKVYPSFLQMRKFHLMAISNRLQEAGIKRLRKLGHSSEFEQIRDYVRGDDYRIINWKATSRKGSLMINNYTDEKSQQVYSVINIGRVMKMPFEGMTLLDYAINASLVLSNVALLRQDKAGLISFAEKVGNFVTADKRPGQMNRLMETLYNQNTRFLEADYERLYATIRNRMTSRGLIVLFTNFESLEALQRELPALKRIAHYHLLLVVFFENTAISGLLEDPARDLEQVYIKTIAEKFAFEKKQMVRELRQNGIMSVLTRPQDLTVHTINKYLELKNRNFI